MNLLPNCRYCSRSYLELELQKSIARGQCIQLDQIL